MTGRDHASDWQEVANRQRSVACRSSRMRAAGTPRSSEVVENPAQQAVQCLNFRAIQVRERGLINPAGYRAYLFQNLLTARGDVHLGDPGIRRSRGQSDEPALLQALYDPCHGRESHDAALSHLADAARAGLT